LLLCHSLLAEQNALITLSTLAASPVLLVWLHSMQMCVVAGA
jgi:hypothetical protein